MNAILNSDKHDRGGRSGVSLQLSRVAICLLVAVLLYAVMAPRVLERLRGRRVQALTGQLTSAVENGDVAAASQTLRAGADVNARRVIDLADARADIPMLELLIDAGAVYHAPKILMTAIRNHSRSLVRRVLQAGADPDTGVSVTTSPLLAAIRVGAVDLAEMLLEFGADVELEGHGINSVGRVRPLHAAILSSHGPRERLEMVQLLLDRGADPEAESSTRKSAMDHAVAIADEQLIALLRGYGGRYGPREAAALGRIDELQEMLQRDPAVLTAAYRPITASRPDESATLLGIAIYLAKIETARFLIDAGAPLDTREVSGVTPLHLAARRSGDVGLVRTLIARGAEIDAQDDYRDTPLAHCATVASVEIITALLKAGADVNASGASGTALHLAVWKERSDVVEVLLAAGADPTIPDSWGRLPIDLAADRDSPLAKRLEAASAEGNFAGFGAAVPPRHSAVNPSAPSAGDL